MNRTAVPLAFLALVACKSTLTGNEGNFQFSYQADDRITDFNKPIAVGARLDVQVADVGTQLPVEVLAAAFDDTAVLDVVSFNADTIVIEGVGTGGALLEVEATNLDGETLADSVNLQAKVPEVSRLGHTCTTEADAAYLTGQTIYVPFELEMSNSQPVIGYGYYPFTSSDDAVLTVDSSWQGQQYAAYATGDAGAVSLTSDIDGTTLALDVVEAGQIDGVAEPIGFVLEDIDAGDRNAFYVHPKVGGLTVCQADTTKAVESLTPDICTVEDSSPADGTSYEYGWFEVTGVAAGTCEYTVTFDAGDNGAGVTETFSVTIEP